MDTAQILPQHRWLDRLLGEWSYQVDTTDETGKPVKHTGTEVFRTLAGIWFIGEGDGNMGESLMTLGYDPDRKRFVGSYVGGMMSTLWIYDGALDAGERVLTLESEGPSFTDQTRRSKYRDVMAFASDDQRSMTSEYQDDSGAWQEFMVTRYRRTT